jgi:hypothetical protein
MARVVVLSFRENESAESFLKLLQELQEGNARFDSVVPNFNLTLQEMGLILGAGAKAEALLARPTLPGCQCKYKNQRDWYKTKKFGWFVCPRCRRPHVLVIQGYISNLLISGGNNLLSELEAREAPPAVQGEPCSDTADTPSQSPDALPIDTQRHGTSPLPSALY